MYRKLPPPDELLRMLRLAPVSIAESTRGLSAGRLRQPPPAGGWSINEVLAHLRSCADVWGDCISAILAETNPTLRAINPATWIKSTDYPDLPFADSFGDFQAQRAALVARLERLDPESWKRSATVVGAGRPLERSVHVYTEFIAVHERAHLKQVRRIAGGYGEAAPTSSVSRRSRSQRS